MFINSDKCTIFFSLNWEDFPITTTCALIVTHIHSMFVILSNNSNGTQLKKYYLYNGISMSQWENTTSHTSTCTVVVGTAWKVWVTNTWSLTHMHSQYVKAGTDLWLHIWCCWKDPKWLGCLMLHQYLTCPAPSIQSAKCMFLLAEVF